MMEFSPLIAAIIAFLICGLSGYIVIPYLRKLKFGQTILEIGPKWHAKKEGTPTMGGIMIVVGVIISVFFAIMYSAFANSLFILELKTYGGTARFVSGIGLAIAMGLIGFVDDYIKVVKKRNLGLTAKQKTFLQFFVSGFYLVSLALSGMSTTWIPFAGQVDITSGLGLVFWPIALFFIYGFTNAVNISDGIDGLASSVTLVVCCAFMFLAGFSGNISYNTLAASYAGACAGFALWNSYPAKVFMGDTGSMFLGGCVVGLSFGIGAPILLVLAGILYVIEALSVIIQVAYFKKTKKRFFKMAPIHHHFELSGWSEGKIVFVFSFITFIGCAISILVYLLS